MNKLEWRLQCLKRVKFVFGLLVCLFTTEVQGYVDYERLQLSSSPFVVDSSYLSKHDIVYFSPTQLEAEGFPMGNGNMGGMVWNTDNGIELQINKNDLWSGISADEFNTSILKHAARLRIDFGIPVYSWIHLKDFEGRLSLKRGEATFKSSTAYTATNVNTWLAHNRNIWVIECSNFPVDKILGDQSLATVTLERLGSRAFSGWYGGWFAKNPAVGIGDTRSFISGRDMIIEEVGEGLHFAVACRVLADDFQVKALNLHRVECRTERKSFIILLSVVTGRENADPVNSARKLLDEVEICGIDRLRREKDEWYDRFWSNSFVKLGNDYLENIYYLRRYLMAAGSQGEFPVAFNGGLWRWNRDVLNWVTPHHWNTQQQYWGLCAQNDCQLMLPYLDTYFNMIPYGTALAEEKGASSEALLITEAHCFTGEQVGKDANYLKNNLTPASQIASLFWEYYTFTEDKEFLRTKGYVFMKKAAQFYLDKLEWDDERQEYFLKASLYESAPIAYVKNPISDRNCIEQLFRNCIQAAEILKTDKGKIHEWKYVLGHLWKYGFETLGDCGEVLSPAEEYYTEKRYSPWIWGNGGAIAFPASLIGIDDRDTRLGQAVIHLLAHSNEANAHYPYPEIAARMGEGDKALTYILNGLERHQIYPQGLMHNVTGYPDNIYDLASKHDLLNRAYVIRSHDFFQCGMEPMSNYATAVNEMLLQSNENKIRVFPAIPSAWDTTEVAFTLRAKGAFIISACRNRQAKVSQVGIKSLKGNMCRLQNPWPNNKSVTVYQVGNENRKLKFKMDMNGVISFPTRPDTEYVVTTEKEKEPILYRGKTNQCVKRLGNRFIGKNSGWNDFALDKS